MIILLITKFFAPLDSLFHSDIKESSVEKILPLFLSHELYHIYIEKNIHETLDKNFPLGMLSEPFNEGGFRVKNLEGNSFTDLFTLAEHCIKPKHLNRLEKEQIPTLHKIMP